MPSTPISCSAVFTASSLEFWMTASTLVMMLFSDSDPYGLRQQRAATLGNQSFSRQELSYSRKRSRLRTQHRTRSLYRLKSLHGNRNYLSHPSGFVMQSPVIPSKRSLRSEGSGRAVRSVAFFATQWPRVWLASYSLRRPLLPLRRRWRLGKLRVVHRSVLLHIC